MPVILDLGFGIESHDQCDGFPLTGCARNRACELPAGGDREMKPRNVEHLAAIKLQRLAREAVGELQRQDSHTDKIRAMNALK